MTTTKKKTTPKKKKKPTTKPLPKYAMFDEIIYSDPEDIDKELEDIFQELLAVLSNNTKGQK